MSMCDLCSDELGFFDECDPRDCHKRKGGINKMSGWISVKDRLPEKYQDCIIFGKNNKHPAISRKIFTSQYDGKRFVHINIKYYEVTHWMPLPEPPK